MQRADRATRYVRWYRVLLAIVAMAVIGLGFVEPEVQRYNPFAPRIVLGGFAIVGLLGSLVWPWLRDHLREWLTANGYMLLAWFLYTSHVNGMGVDNVVSLVPIVVLVAALARTRAEVLALSVSFLAGAAFAYAGPNPDTLPFSVLVVLLGAVVVGLGGMSLSRAELEDALDHANAGLEQRVHQRTLALAAANDKLRAEIVERELAQAAAQQASQAKSTFLANMSHELRTPLTAILGYAEILEEEDLSAQARTDLGRVRSSAAHLLTIIQDVLDLARIESQQIELAIRRVDLSGIMEASVELTSPMLETSRDLLVVTVPPGLEVDADPVRLRQVFVNLLSNAAKFTRDGEVRFEASVHDDVVCVGVVDTGIGMSPELVARVFDRFSQGDESPTRQHGGTGLGLAISRELVRAMGGDITVSSIKGEGSTFTVSLPRV
ncbi:MAG: HAMP domain-containing histidine kinase [Myxococcales bacterium]|nr:HAMP domain-containing histidine kinase [Myxococcales bacterium]